MWVVATDPDPVEEQLELLPALSLQTLFHSLYQLKAEKSHSLYQLKAQRKKKSLLQGCSQSPERHHPLADGNHLQGGGCTLKHK